MNIFSRKKIFILISLLFLILILLIVLLYKQRQIPPKPVLRAEEPGLLFSVNPSIKKYYDIYTNTNVGDNINNLSGKLPQPKKINPLPDNATEYFYDSGYPLKDNEIVAKNDIVVFKRLVILNEQATSMPQLDSYVKLYGEPEAVYQGSASYGRFMKTYVYSSRGFALILNQFTGEIFEIQTFEPTSIDDYVRRWGGDIKQYSDEPTGP